MGKHITLIGKTFNRLFVSKKIGKDKHGNVLWECVCSCKKKAIVSSASLLSGNTKSCGCYKIEKHLAYNKSRKGTFFTVKKILDVNREQIFQLIKQGKSAWQIEKESTISSPTIKKYVKIWNPVLYQMMRENGRRNKALANYIDGRGITRKFKTDCCFDCGVKNERLEIHHLKPIKYSKNWQARDGDHSPENLVTLCNSCHQKRHWRMKTRIHKVKHNKLTGRFLKNE